MYPPKAAQGLRCQVITVLEHTAGQTVRSAPPKRGLPFWSAACTKTGNCSRYSRPGGIVGNFGIGHACQYMRRHARRLNYLACAFLRPPDANCLRRHCYARLRMPNTPDATDSLSATVLRERQTGFRTSSTKIPVSCTD